MLAVMLRCLFGLIINFNWGWTKSVYTVSQLLHIKKDTIFKIGKAYLNADDITPIPLEMRQRGRGSDTFKANGSDRYSLLKEVHLQEIMQYVVERNISQRGMCTVKSIQAHLLQWCGTFFEHHVVYYALSKRLGFKYRSPACKRLVFSPERTQQAFKFCGKMDYALKEERAGRAIIIYMDETYCHLQHVPGKMWYRDEDIGTERSERSRSKGSLQIILHAMFKGGWILVRDGDGNVPVLEEWHEGDADTCEMVFRGKVAGGDYHENMDGVMFMKWINTRLVPTMRKLHPGKKVFLVMDNAPYHHGRSEDTYFCAGRKKDDIQGKL